jgi:predicted protein tyrosine phosphatase
LAPTEEQVVEAVEYASKVKGTLLIHCAAGQSRSVGIALSIHCSKGLSPSEAFDALKGDVNRTWKARLRHLPDDFNPNGRIVMHADKLYGYEGKLIDEYCVRHTGLSLEDARSCFWDSVTKREEEDPFRLPIWDHS